MLNKSYEMANNHTLGLVVTKSIFKYSEDCKNLSFKYFLETLNFEHKNS